MGRVDTLDETLERYGHPVLPAAPTTRVHLFPEIMGTAPTIDTERLLSRLATLAAIGESAEGGRTRLALTESDKAGRDLVAEWMRKAGANVHVDHIGNICGILNGSSNAPPIMLGSHIDTVVSAGPLDGCYGVIAGIEVISALGESGYQLNHPIAVCAFTNEEGVRFQPDLLGSRVMAGEIGLQEALAIRADDTGNTIARELQEIGYAGQTTIDQIRPCAFLEAHIEQGPVLDEKGLALAIVESVQGHSWWRVKLRGVANHAGTTPMAMRYDAGFEAMSLAARLTAMARDNAIPSVTTIGSLELKPNAVNVVPGEANFTIDFRDPSENTLHRAELFLEERLEALRGTGFEVECQKLSEYAPVHFDKGVCDLLESVATEMKLPPFRMVSGASHDAQIMASICPTAMIFVPSIGGISHNPEETTKPEHLAVGAEFLFNAVAAMDRNPGYFG